MHQTPQTLAGHTVHCLLFDLGHTLWTPIDGAAWDEIEVATLQHALAVLQTYIAPDVLAGIDIVALTSQLRPTIQALIYARIRQDQAHEPNFASVTRDALLQLGLPAITNEAAGAVFEALRIRIVGSRVLFEDALSTLRTLRERGFLLGVVSNRHYGGPVFQQDLQALGLFDCIDPRHFAISADLGLRKPTPAIFQYALDALGAAAEETVMVGDALTADVAGAKQLGMATVWKPKPHLWAEAKAAWLAADNVYTRNFAEYVLTYTLDQKPGRDQQEHLMARPDMVIEHLHELLDVFGRPGPQ